MRTVPQSRLAVQEVLLDASSAVQQISGVNVWHRLAKAKWQNESPAVIFHVEAESGHAAGAVFFTDAVFKCYGGTAHESDAEAVAHAVIKDFHQLTGRGAIMRSDLTVSAPGGPEPVTGWPVHIVKMRLQIAA